MRVISSNLHVKYRLNTRYTHLVYRYFYSPLN